MRKRTTLAAGLISGALVLLPAASAFAAPVTILNGDFQADEVGSTSVTGWTVMNEAVDLGVTSIAGCVSQDTSTYTALRGYDDEAGATLWNVPVDGDDVVLDADGVQVWVDDQGVKVAPNTAGAWAVKYGSFLESEDSYDIDFYVTDDGVNYAGSDTSALDGGSYKISDFLYALEESLESIPDPSVRADSPVIWDEDPEYGVEVTDMVYNPDTEEDELYPSKVLKLSSDVDSNSEGYVTHGPAVYSDTFSVFGPRTISLNWMAAGVSDDYHVLGYLLNVDTCEQTEILDSTGESQDWTSASVDITKDGNYRFVFIAGSYDQSWGGAAGAELYIDDIKSLPTVSGTGLGLGLWLELGEPVASAPVELVGAGLEPESEWIATLSNGVEISRGTTDTDGGFYQMAALPSSVPAGKHIITLSGMSADGELISYSLYITVGEDGTLLYASFDGPEGNPIEPADDGEKLASTGADTSALGWAAGALLIGAAVVTAGAVRRRKATA